MQMSLYLVLLLGLLCNYVGMSTMVVAAAACDYSTQICGSTSIPYPFGIDPQCGLPDYRVNCTQNSSLGSGLFPFLQLNDTTQFQVLSFSPASLIINTTDFKAESCDETQFNSSTIAVPVDKPFRFSNENIFAVIGCRSQGSFTTLDDTGNMTDAAGCTNPCYNSYNYDYCNDYPCCTIELPLSQVVSIQIRGAGIAYSEFPGKCGFSMVLDPITYVSTAPGEITAGHYGMKLSWGIAFPENAPNCSTVNTTSGYACSENSECINAGAALSYAAYACSCLHGYYGDGYTNGTGCQDIDECAESSLNNCTSSQDHGICTNLPGTYSCSCRKGAKGDGIAPSSNGTGCTVSPSAVIPASIAAAVAVIVVISAGLIGGWIYIRATKAKYWERNGGPLLQGHREYREGRPRLFSEAELRKATQNFAEEIGRGGQGTVYKGVLSKDVEVAIKQSHLSGEEEVQQFINELIILSDINHRNIVRLLGCCLKTKVPTLVYEYIPNGNLFEHLQGKYREKLSWERRLAIAVGSSEAIAHLHSSLDTPVYHRDIKSTNILLDKQCNPKVADFGISRRQRLDETDADQTVPKGTLGYLDPACLQTYQLNDKSDVYSFAVVLLELITSLKPFDVGREERNLARLCISSWEAHTFPALIDKSLGALENSRVMEAVNQVAKLAFTCLRFNANKRPAMKEVYQELFIISRSRESMVAKYATSLGVDPDDEERQALLLSVEGLLQSSDSLIDMSGASSSHPISGLRDVEMAMLLEGHRGR